MKLNGLTLLELLFTFSLFCLLVLFTVSSWLPLQNNNDKDLIVEEIKNIIHYSKLRALNEGVPLLLSPNHSKNWSTGFHLNSVLSGELLYQWQWNHQSWMIEWYGVNGSESIVLPGTTRAMSNGTFVLTNKINKTTIRLVLNKLGRVKET